jgi:hypothetical protein
VPGATLAMRVHTAASPPSAQNQRADPLAASDKPRGERLAEALRGRNVAHDRQRFPATGMNADVWLIVALPSTASAA